MLLVSAATSSFVLNRHIKNIKQNLEPDAVYIGIGPGMEYKDTDGNGKLESYRIVMGPGTYQEYKVVKK